LNPSTNITNVSKFIILLNFPVSNMIFNNKNEATFYEIKVTKEKLLPDNTELLRKHFRTENN